MNFIQLTIEDALALAKQEQPSFAAVISAQNLAEVPREPSYTPPKGKMAKLLQVMKGGSWFSPLDLCQLTGISPLSITARLRDLRKEEFGSHTVEARDSGNDLWVYRFSRLTVIKDQGDESA